MNRFIQSKFVYLSIFFVAVVLSPINSLGAPLEISVMVDESSDSLTLFKNNSTKTFVILPGEAISVFYDGTVIQGTIISSDSSRMLLNVDEHIIPIVLSQITKIQVFKSKASRVFAVPLLVTGVAGMLFGGISLVAGTLALFSANIGSIVLFAVLPLGASGFGLFKLGSQMNSRKFNMTKKWRC